MLDYCCCVVTGRLARGSRIWLSDGYRSDHRTWQGGLHQSRNRRSPASELESATEAEVQSAIARANDAQPAWAALGVRKRIAILKEFQRLLHQKKSEVAQLITREAGKPYVEALLTEVLVVLDAARFLIEERLSACCVTKPFLTAIWR